MDKNDIELLVDKKVAEAKLDVTEKRLKFVIGIAGAMLAFFGVLVPLWQTNKASDKVDSALTQMKQDIKSSSQDLRTDSRASSESIEKAMQTIKADVRTDIDRQSQLLSGNTSKVDNAIQDMQKRFKELEGAHLRKPVLECLLAGQSLEGSILKFSPSHNEASFQVKNSGDAPARNIRMRLYIAYDGSCEGILTQMPLPFSDEPNYKCAYEDYVFHDRTIDPKETRTFEIDTQPQNIKPGTYPSLLKVFYEQPEPRKYSFSINSSDK
jgi:hypothetical protein